MENSYSPITGKLAASLHMEAILLSDEARGYFESDRFFEHCSAQNTQFAFEYSTETLKISTRLMHCVVWILNLKAAVNDKEYKESSTLNLNRRLCKVTESDWDLVGNFPVEMRVIAMASEDLYDRLQRLERRLLDSDIETSQVHEYINKLRISF